ncbi:fibropellin-1-like [Dysidea avara]|uniref:fibropellin-1-like n=1 Tax=Dysidea avara TaxID=196820 RepID=UPI00331A4671
MGVSLSHTAVGMMKLLFVFVCSLCCSVIRGQSLCSSPPGYLVIADHFASEVESELAGRNTFVFIEIYYNCVAYGGTDGTKFRQMTITGRYQVDSRIHLGYALYQCINPGAPQWDNLGVILRNGSTINDTTRGCANCQGMTNHTCTPCHSSCTGLKKCTGTSENDCCNYLDKNQCTTRCGTNMVASSATNYSCVCSGLHTGLDCMACNRSLCQYGMASVDCSGCVCDNGYTGLYCDSDIDECNTPGELCKNNGTCTNTDGSFTCNCPVNYGGPTCADQCYACCSNPCTRGGTCVSNNSSFTCLCIPGWEGPRCQDFVGGCYSDPCMNGGICIATNTIDLEQYECRCPLGYTGVNCEMQIDYCAINDPCQNGGWCINALTEPLCECLQGFVGPYCEQPLLTCHNGTCGKNGSCINRTVERTTAIFCTCDFGYIGELCDTLVTDCNMDPCYHRSTCSPSATTADHPPFDCMCHGYWSGHYCTECSLHCENSRSDAQCTRCICNNNNMCDTTTTATPEDYDNSGIIIGPTVATIITGIIFLIIACVIGRLYNSNVN